MSQLEALFGEAAFDALTRQALSDAPRATVPKGQVIFSPGNTPSGFILVLAGSVRVTRLTEAGRELVLYRIAPGESCVLTTACLLAEEEHAAEAVAETEVSALILPPTVFGELLERSASFRSFVFKTFGARMLRLTQLLENLAFERVDVRLADLLLSRAADDGELRATHQELANELGTAREVVSRHLELFRERGWVELGRGHLRLLDSGALRRACGK